MNTKKLLGGLLAVLVAALVYQTFFSNSNGLEEFITVTEADPLMYSPVFTSDFIDATGALDRSDYALRQIAIKNIEAKEAPYSEPYASILRKQQLLPTGFLERLPNITFYTNELRRRGTNANAEKLLTEYRDAAGSYASYAERLSKTFAAMRDYLPEDYNQHYFFTDTATTFDIIENDVNLILKNARALEADVEQRATCLHTGKSCEVREAVDVAIAPRADVHAHQHAALVTQTALLSPSFSQTGPAFSVQSPCWRSQGDEVTMHLLQSDTKPPFSLPKLATANYYRVVPETAEDVIGRAVQANGLSFYYQPAGTTYECTDLNFYPQLLTAVYAAEHPDEDLRQLAQNPFGLIAPAIRATENFTTLLTTAQEKDPDLIISPHFLYPTRSAYSLFAMPYAQSVWRIDEQPKYVLDKEYFEALDVESPYKTLEQLLTEGFSEAEIMRAHIPQAQLLEE